MSAASENPHFFPGQTSPIFDVVDHCSDGADVQLRRLQSERQRESVVNIVANIRVKNDRNTALSECCDRGQSEDAENPHDGRIISTVTFRNGYRCSRNVKRDLPAACQYSMATVEDVKRQRDLALKAWRQELQRFADLQKWLQERQEKAALELEKQRDVVSEARARYESSNEVYLNRLAASGLSKPETAESGLRP